MKNKDRKNLKQNVASVSRDNNKDIEIYGGAGEIGIKSFKVAEWKPKCISYFNRYFKASPVIVGPSDSDRIMSTLSSVCSGSKSRGFVFKNYNIVKHMKFLGYPELSLLGAAPASEIISYIAYIEQKNVIFICEKVLNGFSTKSLVVMVKYFLTLYNREIQGSGVKVIGLLIRENEKHEELLECSFCNLFILSPKDFESPATFKVFWNTIENYEGWWNFANTKEQNKLFNDLAAEILCFMAVHEKGLPTLTNDRSQQFKQTYFMYTPQQMSIHFSNAKHVVIQGSYGSGKSILGLKKLELIWKDRNRKIANEKIIYINFDSKSELHYLMEKNVKEYVKISSRKIKSINGIGKISEFPNHLIYLCHNSAGENLSAILQDTVSLNMNTSETARINYHLIIEEYDGETLSHVEAAKITKLVRDGGLMKSNIILLAQPLTKRRSLSIGKESYEGESSMFHELESLFKIEKLHKVLRCSNEICGLTKSAQNFVRNKQSVFEIETDKLPFEQQQQPEGNEKHTVSRGEVGTSAKSETSANKKGIKKADEKLYLAMDLDQAFKKSATLQNNNAAKNKIVSEFGFLCEPSQGVDIEGIKPSLFEFSVDIDFPSKIAVVSLALVLKKLIDKNKIITILHMADEQPEILRRTIQLVEKLFKKLSQRFLCAEDIKEYLREKSSKMIFSSNFCRVNGMEFDHVVIVVSQSEYYLQYYLPQVISRCTYDLTIVLLPKDEVEIDEVSWQEPSAVSPRIEDDDTKETVAKMIDKLKRDGSVKQVVAAECKACENSCISNETDNEEMFIVHTHSDQYKEHLSLLADHAESEEETRDASVSAFAVSK